MALPQAARLARCSREALIAAAKAGEVTAHCNGRWFFAPKSLAWWIRQREERRAA